MAVVLYLSRLIFNGEVNWQGCLENELKRSFVQNCNQVESNSLTKSDECACWAELNWELIKLLNCRVMSCMHRVVYAGIYEVFIHGISRINNLIAVKFEVEIWWTNLMISDFQMPKEMTTEIELRRNLR